MDPETSQSQPTGEHNATSVILARLEAMSRDMAKMSAGIEKLDSDVVSMKDQRPYLPPNPNPLNQNQPNYIKGYGREEPHGGYGSYGYVYLGKEEMRGRRGINTIKVGLLTFKGESDPEEFLAWESSCERIFQVNDLTEEKKSCYTIAYFKGYATMWWEYVKRFDNVLIEGQPAPWFRVSTFVSLGTLTESYHQELFARLYNLKQGNKSVVAYYDKFQQLILKLDHREEQVSQDIVQFMVGLNRDIASHLTLHKFDTIEDIFQAGWKLRGSYGKMRVLSLKGDHSRSEKGEEEEEPRVKVVGFAHNGPLLITNRDTSTLPSIHSSYVQVGECLSLRSMLDDLMRPLVEHPNLEKSNEEMMPRVELADDDCLNLRANSSQDREDDTSVTTKLNLEDGKHVKKVRTEFTPDDLLELKKNAKAKNILVCGLGPAEYNRISTCTTAKQIWDALVNAYEGTSQVRKFIISLLFTEYKAFKMKENKTLHEMITTLTALTNELTSLGKAISKEEQVEKVLRVLPKSKWNVKVIAIREANKDLAGMTLDELVEI
ncbi:hypothetical protein FXO37_24075 [Capsicum annuum]|nr:hypothetical protein FXO37_24075 [Capsicum annuum]